MQKSAASQPQSPGYATGLPAGQTWTEIARGLTGAAPRILNAQAVHQLLGDDDILLVYARTDQSQSGGYIPGSAVLDTSSLYRADKKTEGLMPHPADLAAILSSAGIQPKHHVVVYDDETGVDAARLLWLLEAFGHPRHSLLSGGVEAWLRNGFPVTEKPIEKPTSLYPVREYLSGFNLEKREVQEAIADVNTVLVDTRSIPEFNGLDVRAERGGRIPGAVNIAWDELIDYYDTGEILPDVEIERLLLEYDIGRDKRIIVYCQSNRRSAHTYVVLKQLGYNVSTYAGSWSEWGNDPSLPIEQ